VVGDAFYAIGDAAEYGASYVGLGKPARFTFDVPGGLLNGAGEMVEGIGTMIGKPVQTLSGINQLMPWSENPGEAWSAMGAGLLRWEDWESGDWGKAIGKLGFDVVLTIGTAGSGTAVAAATRGASTAAKMSMVAKAGNMLKHPAMTAKVMTMQAGRNLARTPAMIGKGLHGIAKMPGNLVKIGSRAPSGTVLRTSQNINAATKTAQIASEVLVNTKILGKTLTKNTVDDLVKVSDDLGEMGKVLGFGEPLSPEHARQLVNLQKQTQNIGKLNNKVQVLKTVAEKQRTLSQFDPALAKLPTLKSPRQIERFIAKYNKGSSTLPIEQQGQILQFVEGKLEQVGKGALGSAQRQQKTLQYLMVDDTGKLKLAKNLDEVENVARNTTGKLQVRTKAAEHLLERPLTPLQEEGLRLAHEVGTKEGRTISQLTRQDLVTKGKLLTEAGFSKTEITKFMDHKVAGMADALYYGKYRTIDFVSGTRAAASMGSEAISATAKVSADAISSTASGVGKMLPKWPGIKQAGINTGKVLGYPLYGDIGLWGATKLSGRILKEGWKNKASIARSGVDVLSYAAKPVVSAVRRGFKELTLQPQSLARRTVSRSLHRTNQFFSDTIPHYRMSRTVKSLKGKIKKLEARQAKLKAIEDGALTKAQRVELDDLTTWLA